MKLYINLINFNSNKLAGVGYFFKRIVSNIDFEDEKWDKFDEIILLSNTKVECLSLFDINANIKIRVIKFSFVHNFVIRILFEQFVLPFYLIRGKNVFFSPTPSIPLWAKILNKKNVLISSIHDMIPFRVDNKYSFLRSLYIKGLSKKAAQNSDTIITVSEFSKHDIVEITNIETSKIKVIYNFIPELKFSSETISEPYFVTVCTIEPGKNIENMIIGFNDFLNKNIEFGFYKYKIVGQLGWGYDKIISLIKDLGLEEKVEIMGYLSDSEKNSVIEKCTGMVYLSRYEGFGIPPLEAMYFNKISIVSNVSSLPEVVGTSGIVQDPNDTVLLSNNLKRLITNSDDFRVNIKYQIEKFNPKIQIEKFVEVITYYS
ncbi:glycosyltransferase family 4 protein [Flavobacterium bizetiae]|uniref:glycosyltransferase family 4 protein n=1 Tax=Flavobacterium bizetiae TaxID=2704140 RepID=UPI0021E74F7B|nr:glycosyltransferase family 1 protein [Flavobacterium bizetiae]UTN04628.1 glycosyltransferase family 4 protein [Flavobacterium bizetiae]